MPTSVELLRLLVVPDDVNVTEVGQTFLFACTAASTDGSVAIMWLHNGLAVHNASGVRTHHSTQLEGDLTIASSVLELCVTSHVHIGGYSCEVHQEQQQQQEKAHFQVRGKPLLWEVQVRGKPLLREVEVRGKPLLREMVFVFISLKITCRILTLVATIIDFDKNQPSNER